MQWETPNGEFIGIVGEIDYGVSTSTQEKWGLFPTPRTSHLTPRYARCSVFGVRLTHVLFLLQVALAGVWLYLVPLPKPLFFFPSEVRPRASRCLCTGFAIQLILASRRIALWWGLNHQHMNERSEWVGWCRFTSESRSDEWVKEVEWLSDGRSPCPTSWLQWPRPNESNEVWTLHRYPSPINDSRTQTRDNG